jgi:hypothetical protein
VIEQKAFNRSPGSSISLMRTSVISTAVLLTIERFLLVLVTLRVTKPHHAERNGYIGGA